ncbi:MAG: hypothetical protein Q4G58_04165 [bacterium]|nr:hypothetical protein [bacterium]
MKLRQLHKFSRAIQLKASKQYIAAATGGKLHICEKETFHEIETFGPMKNGYDIYIPKDEKTVIVTTCNNPLIYIWSLEDQEKSRRIRVGKGQEAVREGEAALSLDGKHLYVIVNREDSLCDKIVEIDLETNKEVSCYLAEDSFTLEKIIPLPDHTFFLMGYKRGVEEHDYFIAKFDGKELTKRIPIKHTTCWVKHYTEQHMITWYDDIMDCLMCFDGEDLTEISMKWCKPFDTYTYAHYYDRKNNRLYFASINGFYVADMSKKEIIDSMPEKTSMREFIYLDGQIHVYDQAGILYAIEKIGEAPETKR